MMMNKSMLAVLAVFTVLSAVIFLTCKTAQTDDDADNNQYYNSGGAALLSWPVLYAEALCQAIEIETGNAFETSVKREKSSLFWGGEASDIPVLAVYIKERSQTDNMLVVLLLPWEDFSYTLHVNADDQPLIVPQMYAVSTGIIVCEPFPVRMSIPDEIMLTHISEIVPILEKVVQKTVNGRPIRDYLSAPMPRHLQVISEEEYKHYVELHVSQPGSRIPDDEVLAALAPGRMIMLTEVAEWGTVQVRWLMPEKSGTEQELERELYSIYKQTLEKAKSAINDQVARRRLFFETKEKLEQMIKDSSLYTNELSDDLQHELLALLYLDDWVLREEETLEMFPDYAPKLTEDTVLDYRPALSAKIGELPEAKTENLAVLVHLLEELKDLAARNPGTFEKGRIMLGADMDQYVPSDEECLESEVGDRIAAIVAEMSRQELRGLLNRQGITAAKISYRKINYRHADVMGSGRFFYADKPVEVFILK